jgi:hypothetical protein
MYMYIYIYVYKYRGLAAPLNSGEGDRDALPLTGSLRRPLSGVLKTFALKSLPFRTPTAMEPELAFLMVIIITIIMMMTTIIATR